MRILIVGNRGGTNIGGSFERAATGLGFEVRLVESRLAMEAPWGVRKLNWWFLGRRPANLDKFGQPALEICRELHPACLVATGIAPLKKEVLKEIKSLGIRTVNYLTDDPWNSSHHAAWFIKALPYYDYVFSVRRSSLKNLKNIGCPKVSYLPFGYDPECFYPETLTSEEKKRLGADVIFAGGADRDRVPYIAALIKTGFQVGLYGDYWDRFKETRGHIRGYANPEMLRKAIHAAKVALCLVRRANRDGNSMRTFEIPAVGACMLTEDTAEHREIFGEEGKAVVYFRPAEEMVEKLRWLLSHEEERRRLAESAHRLITQGKHTYKDRLITMLNTVRDKIGVAG